MHKVYIGLNALPLFVISHFFRHAKDMLLAFHCFCYK